MVIIKEEQLINNNENSHIGKRFQEAVCLKLNDAYNQQFETEIAIAIGSPQKLHRFDIVNSDQSIVCECKCYTWTNSGNVPSAKLGSINEAAFYLSFLPENTLRIIALLQSKHPNKKETLAEYYFRTYHHLLGNIKIFEFSPNSNSLISISNGQTM